MRHRRIDCVGAACRPGGYFMDSFRRDGTIVIGAHDRFNPNASSLRHASIGVTPERKKNARPARSASGCLSELSIPIMLDEEYFAALKAFSATYSDYQAYLLQAVPHVIEEGTDIGIDDYALHDPIANSSASISDDEIESCGYLGWLRY